MQESSSAQVRTSQKASHNQSMNATIVLDQQPANASYTNLDQISGRAIVRCTKSADISSIVVKRVPELLQATEKPLGIIGVWD